MLGERIDELIHPYRTTERTAQDAPTGARLAEFHLRMFPRAPRGPGREPTASPAPSRANRPSPEGGGSV
ncbi:hypothetical protein ACFHYQ_27655 [Sphaerimonospora cavernae]|uniref:Uncharacterized protein n=1 Tax=Sphaerimonospora cavernae TaxID=1740611 RepID=A0ABV6UD02_9ACTN